MDRVPEGVTSSTTLLLVSPMYTLPELSTATPVGQYRSELVAGPGVGEPRRPSPAMIDRVPEGVTFSISSFCVSAMYTLPELSTATLSGLSRSELVAGPGVGAPPGPTIPAKMDRVPEGVTF